MRLFPVLLLLSCGTIKEAEPDPAGGGGMGPTDTAARRATHFQNLRSGTSCEKKGKAPIFVGPNLPEEDADGEDDAD